VAAFALPILKVQIREKERHLEQIPLYVWIQLLLAVWLFSSEKKFNQICPLYKGVWLLTRQKSKE
jgi:hypothetical protein